VRKKKEEEKYVIGAQLLISKDRCYRGEQKNRKTDQTEKTGKKITERTEQKKKPIKFLKKPAGSVL